MCTGHDAQKCLHFRYSTFGQNSASFGRSSNPTSDLDSPRDGACIDTVDTHNAPTQHTQLSHKQCNVSTHNQVVRSPILLQHSLDGFIELAVVERCDTASFTLFGRGHENSSVSKSRLEGSQGKILFWCQNLFCALEPRENDGAGPELQFGREGAENQV